MVSKSTQLCEIIVTKRIIVPMEVHFFLNVCSKADRAIECNFIRQRYSPFCSTLGPKHSGEAKIFDFTDIITRGIEPRREINLPPNNLLI